jgi:hypothetical protein
MQRKSKHDLENNAEMREMLDDYHDLFERMVFKGLWDRCANEEELTELLMETRLLAKDFSDAINRIKEISNGSTGK